MKKIDETTLIAYVDGELDAQETHDVEQWIANHAEARDFVAQQLEIAALTRGAFNDTLHAPIPERLLDTVRNTSAQHNHTSSGPTTHASGRPQRWGPLAMAATVAALMIGLGGGYQLAQGSANKALQLASISEQQDAHAISTALNQTLEIKVSGQSHVWQNPDSGRTATITPVRTYQDKNGAFCREYRQEVETRNGNDNNRQDVFGLACREGSGVWKTRYLIIQPETQAF